MKSKLSKLNKKLSLATVILSTPPRCVSFYESIATKTANLIPAYFKIAEQRLLGLPRSDRRGETYWRFDEILEKEKEATPSVNFKCSQCKEEVVIIDSDNPAQELKQREKLKQELAQMEALPKKESQEPQNSKLETKENKQAESKPVQENATP